MAWDNLLFVEMMVKQQEQKTFGMCVLVVSDKLHEATAVGCAARNLLQDLQAHEVDAIVSASAADGQAVIESEPHLQAIVLDWDLHRDAGHKHAIVLLENIRARNANVPVFLLAERNDAAQIPVTVMREADEFIWLLDDTMEFISERIVASVRRYREQLLPPMFAALVKFTREAEYSWHTPGHTGGTAFLRSPVGRACSMIFSASRCSAPICPSRSASSARCSTIAGRSVLASAMPRMCSGRTAPIMSPTAPRPPTAW